MSLIHLIPILFCMFCSFTYAQSHFHLDNYYHSETDRLITIKSVAVLPFTDNTRGIYSKPFHAYVKNALDENPKWNLKPIEIIGRSPFVSDLERNPNKILGYAKNIQADAFIAGKVLKTEDTVSITLALFLAKDGKLFVKEEITNITEAGLKALNSPFQQALEKLFKQLPYDGMILSRKDNLVTLNLSKADGIVNGQDLTVATIIKLKRHPKFNFLINTEKTILGKLRVKKVDESLSFAEIVTEKEKGSIQKGGKIVGSHIAHISNNVYSTKVNSSSPNRGIASVTTGRQWKPAPTPSFGKAGITGGLGLTKKDSGNAYSEKNIVPNITLDGEVWINNKWSGHVMLHHGVSSIADPDDNADLSFNNSAYELLGGYNFRVGGIFDTKFEFLAGYSRFTSSVEDATPNTFTTLRYAGVKVGADIVTPIADGNDLLVGASMFMFLKPKLKERPSASGKSSDNRITQFRIYGLKKWQENFYFKGVLKYDNFSTSFTSPITASNLGERNISLNLGVDYFF